MQHPSKKQREIQAKILAELPKKERVGTRWLLRFAITAFAYHRQAEAFNLAKVYFE